MRTFIRNGTLITPTRTLPGHCLVIKDGTISAVLPDEQAGPKAADTVIDAGGMYVTPGLIDMHIHGCAGADTMDAAPDTLPVMSRFLASHGVTAFLPTTISSAGESINAAICAYRKYKTACTAARPLGLHLEGPYLNPLYTGAQPVTWLRKPNPAEYEAWLESGDVRMITLAPELDGALELVRAAVKSGIRAAAGHSDAAFEEALKAADEGLSISAHTFNGMGPLHHRRPGLVGAALSDERIYTELIADGVHVHPAMIRLAVKAKGVQRVLLVTDAMRATGLPDGEYDLGGQNIQVRGGVALTRSGNLAGSTLTLDAAIRNAMHFCGIDFGDALRMASLTPAQALGLDRQKGCLQPGADADVVLWDEDYTVHRTLVEGITVFER